MYVKLFGTEPELLAATKAFKDSGFEFAGCEVRDEAENISAILFEFQLPKLPTTSTAQPRPWDAVLGGKN